MNHSSLKNDNDNDNELFFTINNESNDNL